MNGEVNDVVDRLRAASKFALMDAARETVSEAAGVIEKLRRRLRIADAALSGDRLLSLTTEERDVIEMVILQQSTPLRAAEVLKSLLERTKV